MEIFNDIVLYLNENSSLYLEQLGGHIKLCFDCLIICTILGIPLAYYCSKQRKALKSITIIFQILRIIPSLAVLLVLLPILKTGRFPAMVALILLAFCPVLMNAIDGFVNADREILENAKAIGMNDRQCFFKVHLPLAMPAIFSGIKISAIELISSATLSAKIGAGGLGEIIFTGLGLNRMDMLVLGALSVMGLDLITTFIFYVLEKLLIKGGN